MLEKVENYGDLRLLNENFPKRLQGKQVVETEKLIKQAQTALYVSKLYTGSREIFMIIYIQILE